MQSAITDFGVTPSGTSSEKIVSRIVERIEYKERLLYSLYFIGLFSLNISSLPQILSVATVTPPYQINQHTFAQKITKAFHLSESQSTQLQSIYQNSSIDTRYTVFEEFTKDSDEWSFWGKEPLKNVPGTFMRNEVYRVEAPSLASRAAEKALQEWGGDRLSVTHLIFVSCTGMVAPGVQHTLISRLGLSSSINLIGLNFMGCFGMMKGIDLARAYASMNSSYRVLLVSTELCSLHFQANTSIEAHVTNALFGDGSSSMVIGMDPKKEEHPIWAIDKQGSCHLRDTSDMMSWIATDMGFKMGLKKEVPRKIKESLPRFLTEFLGNSDRFHTVDWAVHPGGRAILEAVEQSLQLSSHSLNVSRSVLQEYGNMSSSTIGFVLNKMRKKRALSSDTVVIGFGPGLTVEALLLKNRGSKE